MTRTLALAAALVVGLHIAAAGAGFSSGPHTGGDNAGYVSLAFSLLDRGAYLDLVDPDEPRATKYPPVYPVVLAGAMGAGARTWTALKLLSFGFMSGAVLLSFLWLARRASLAFAIVSAGLLAVSETVLWHSRWILSDPLFLVLTLASLWSFDRAAENGEKNAWILVGCLVAILAFFTRSAGLPLVLAAAVWLAVERRWRTLAAFALAFGVPALWWSLRTRGVVGTDYVAELWLVDPYRPDLGTVGAADLFARIQANVGAYVGRWIPGGITGVRGTPVAVLGTVMTALAGAGWWLSVRERPRVAEIFAPLYVAVILLWPVVWAGDRFGLPLYPLMLFYAGHALLRLLANAAPALRVAGLTVAVAPLLVPAVVSWTHTARDGEECRRLIRDEGPFACYPSAVHEYVSAATWAGEHLGNGDVVLTRKPRLFYVLSGRKARVYPLTRDPADFLDQALSGGATHVVMDYLDRLGSFYLVPVIQGRTAAFCSLVGFGDITRSRTEIFGILPPSEWGGRGDSALEGGELVVNLRLCEDAAPGATAPVDPPFGTSDIPLLRRLDAS